MGDSSGCQFSNNNLAIYLQGVSVSTSSNLSFEYFTTASLPSSAMFRRVWLFTTQGTLSGTTSTLTLNYTEAITQCPLYNITFEGALNGNLTIHNQVFSANKYITYELTSRYVLVLTIKTPKKILECYDATTPQPYFLSVFINDGVETCKETDFTIADVSGTTWTDLTFSQDSSGHQYTLYQYYNVQQISIIVFFSPCTFFSYFDQTTLLITYDYGNTNPTVFDLTISDLGKLKYYTILNNSGDGNISASTLQITLNYTLGESQKSITQTVHSQSNTSGSF